MKKFLVIALAGLVCLAFTAPAMAKMTFSGLFQTDVFYEDTSGESTSGGYNKTVGGIQGDNGTDRLAIDLANTGNRLYWKWVSDDKKLMTNWQFRPLNANAGETYGSTAGTIEEAYIQWKLSPMVTFRIGKSAQIFAINAPSQTVGRDGPTPIVGIGYANIHGGSAREQARVMIYPADNVRIEFGMFNPDNDGTDANALLGATNAGVNGETVREENVIPRFDLAVNFKVANFTIEPSLTWLQQEFDQVAAGSDDDLTIWGAALGVKAAFGPLSFAAEIATGENLGNGNYVGASPLVGNGGGAVFYNPVGAPATARIEDTENLGGFIDAGFKFGPATLHVIYGFLSVENDGDPAVRNDAGEYDQTAQMFVVNLPISVAKGWTIKPEIGWYDNDDDATAAGANMDYGDTVCVGVGFILKF